MEVKKSGLVGVVLIGVLIWFGLSVWNSDEGFMSGLPFFGTKEVHIEKSFEASSLKNVEVDVSSSDINVIRGNSAQINVRVQGKASSKIASKIDLKAKTKGDTLELGIDQPNGFQFGFHYSNVSITVEVPEKQWNEIQAKVSSGNISVEKIESKSIEAKASSGNIKLTSSQAAEMELSTSSGNIKAADFKADSLKFHTSSGDVSLKDGEAKLKGDATSGNIRLDVDELLHDADLSTGSGNVTVTLDREPKSLAVDYRGGSGSGKIKWDGFRYEDKGKDGNMLKGSFGAGETKLKVTTGSGNFKMD